MYRPSRQFVWTYLNAVTLLCFFFSPTVFAKLADIEQAQALSRQTYVQRFSDFTQEKNVMGRARTPMGEVLPGKIKQSFNPDDQITFQSDLTYHDFAYETEDKAYNDANAPTAPPGSPNGPGGSGTGKTRKLSANISPHGASGAGTGSSMLERAVYQVFDQYKKAEDDAERKKAQEATGKKFDGAFEVETQKVEKKANSNGKDDGPDEVSRWKFRPEAVAKINEVGDFSFKGVERASKDPDKQEDPKVMGNLERYYWAANQGLEAMWNSVAANLGQSRAYKQVSASGGGNVELSEDTPTCADWASKAIAQIDPKDPDDVKQRKTQDINKQRQQCEQITDTSFKRIDPQFDKDQGGKDTIVDKGPNFENARERDARVQLEVLSKVGTKANEVQSNWKYSDKDDKALVTVDYDKQGNSGSQKEMRMDEQVEKYNQQLRDATTKLPDIQARYPELSLQADQITKYQIKPKSKSAKEITQFPVDAADPEFEGLTNKQPQPKLPDSYNKLVNQKQ